MLLAHELKLVIETQIQITNFDMLHINIEIKTKDKKQGKAKIQDRKNQDRKTSKKSGHHKKSKFAKSSKVYVQEKDKKGRTFLDRYGKPKFRFIICIESYS